jgi:hypothetical protein
VTFQFDGNRLTLRRGDGAMAVDLHPLAVTPFQRFFGQ